MFKCQKCQQTTKPGETQEHIVVAKRDKIYYEVNRRGESYEAGRGWEIAKEIVVCKKCYELHQTEEEKDVEEKR
jgi:hypothetical protein